MPVVEALPLTEPTMTSVAPCKTREETNARFTPDTTTATQASTRVGRHTHTRANCVVDIHLERCNAPP